MSKRFYAADISCGVINIWWRHHFGDSGGQVEQSVWCVCVCVCVWTTTFEWNGR